jgi:glucose/mannose-6-phosphate isomerase
MVRAAASAESPVPIIVHEHSELPGFVDRGTLVVVVATTDDDEELSEAAGEAEHVGAHLIVIAVDGLLAERAAGWEAPRVRLESGPTADVVAFEAVAAMVAVLAHTELFPTGWADLDDARRQMNTRLGKVTVDPSSVERLARQIGRGFPLIQGGGELGAAAARWWKRSVNVMAKVPSWASAIPPACLDEVAGWGQHGDVTRQLFHLIVVRHEMEHPQLAASYPALEDWQLEVVAGLHEVWGEGESALGQGLDLMVQGSLLAWQLAVDAGVDPGPAPAIDAMLRTLRS